ncbi:MAG: hypothetical protein HKL88_07485 [Bacteroidia bacterium]|nr:hypothetical protein [Bacteroidia bacterium]
MELRKGLTLPLPDSLRAILWYNIGGASYTLHDWNNARIAWDSALRFNPRYTDAQRGIEALNDARL